jgi:hypothetical protein
VQLSKHTSITSEIMSRISFTLILYPFRARELLGFGL